MLRSNEQLTAKIFWVPKYPTYKTKRWSIFIIECNPVPIIPSLPKLYTPLERIGQICGDSNTHILPPYTYIVTKAGINILPNIVCYLLNNFFWHESYLQIVYLYPLIQWIKVNTSRISPSFKRDIIKTLLLKDQGQHPGFSPSFKRDIIRTLLLKDQGQPSNSLDVDLMIELKYK